MKGMGVIMRKLLALITLILTLTLPIDTFAQEPARYEKKSILLESHQQIKDYKKLIKLAIKQTSEHSNSGKGEVHITGNKKNFNSDQLVEKRLYDGGLIEEDYVSNSIAVFEDMNQIDASKVASVTPSGGYIYQDGTKSGSGTSGNCVIVQTLYFTCRYTDPVLKYDQTFRVNRVETTVPQQSGSSLCTYFQHGYHIVYDLTDDHKFESINSPITYHTYTVYSSNPNFYPKDGGINNQIYSYVDANISNGSTISFTCQIQATP